MAIACFGATGGTLWVPTIGGTMQIDWSKAPEWARYVAMDADGTWFWFEKKPHKSYEYWVVGQGLQAPVFELDNWQSTLQERPQ